MLEEFSLKLGRFDKMFVNSVFNESPDKNNQDKTHYDI